MMLDLASVAQAIIRDDRSVLSLPRSGFSSSTMALPHWLAYSSSDASAKSPNSNPPVSQAGNGTGKAPNPVPAWAAYPAEVGCAVLSAGLVAPMVGIIDQAIFSNASGLAPMGESIKTSVKTLFTNPGQFFRSPTFRWIWFVYGGTYIAANLTETACVRNDIDWFFPKFVVSSAANIGLSVTKDRAFSRLFGVTAPRAVPVASAGLFGLRDCMTVGGSFNLPIIVSSQMQKNGISQSVSDPAAQLFCPLFMQIFNTPFHLLGMNLYNEPGIDSKARVDFIRAKYIKTLLARWGRIFPAFGIGGLINKPLRKSAQKSLNDHFDPVGKDLVLLKQ
jgi:hypothetical protein